MENNFNFSVNSKQIFRESNSSEYLSIIIAGDTCPWHDAAEAVEQGKSGEILKEIQPYLDAADISVVQWETPLTDDDTPIDKSGPNIKCPPECIDFAKTGKFDIALLANNHIGDFDQAPVMQTIKLFEKNGIKTVGAGKNIEDAVKPLFFEKNGYNIAIINIAEHEFGTAEADKAGCAPLEPLDNIKLITGTTYRADITMVVVHGGNEQNPVPSTRMIKTYRAFADAGANVVINIHTHCPQGIELWNETPIIYCPGNFFFPAPWMDFDANNFWWSGYLPKIYFDRQGVFALEIIPYIFRPDPYRIEPLAGEKKTKFCEYLDKISAIISKGEAEKYFDAWCAVNGPMQIRAIQTDQGKGLRNHFTCESHNELKTNYLCMLEGKRITEAEKLIPELQKLQKADF